MPRLSHLFADIFFRVGWITRGATVLEAALRRDPGDVVARRQRAWALAQLDRHQEAVAENRHVLESSPDDAQSYLGLGISLAALGEHGEAVAALRAAADRDRQNPRIHQQLGASLTAIGKPQEALAAYRRVVHLAPDDVDVIGDVGVALCQLGHPEEALVCLQRAMATRPSGAYAANLGIASAAVGWFAEAEAAYRRALRYEPRSSELKIALAEVVAHQDRRHESIRLLEEVLAVEPASVPALVLLSAVLVADDDADAALTAAERAVQANARDPLAHVALGWAQLNRDDVQAAFTTANQALRLHRRSVDALAIRGAALSALGNHRSAVEAFAEIERTDPAFLDRNQQFAPYVTASRAAHSVGLAEFNP